MNAFGQGFMPHFGGGFPPHGNFGTMPEKGYQPHGNLNSILEGGYPPHGGTTGGYNSGMANNINNINIKNDDMNLPSNTNLK